MRFLAVAAALLSVAAGLSGAGENPFFRVEQAAKDGKVQVAGKNISGVPMVAYVVIAERGHQRVVYYGVYTEGDTLGAGKDVMVGEMPAGSAAEQGRITVDYVRLANGTVWGDAETDQAKEIVARFRK
jgi:hypothetical protein